MAEEVKDEKRTLSVEITQKQYSQLDEIRTFYRASSMGHTVRLMIEDMNVIVTTPEFMKILNNLWSGKEGMRETGGG